MKTKLLLSVMFVLVSCVQSPGPVTSDGSLGKAGESVAGPITMTAPVVRVKNYNQYNMTLEKLTGLSRAKYNDLFEALKGSLPADNDIGGLTSFNLIAMTRLSDAYCLDFVTKEAPLGLSAPLSTFDEDAIRDFLMNRFLDVKDDDNFASLKSSVDSVLANDDGSGQSLFPNVPNTLAGHKQLTVAACVAILASPYVTLLE